MANDKILNLELAFSVRKTSHKWLILVVEEQLIS